MGRYDVQQLNSGAWRRGDTQREGWLVKALVEYNFSRHGVRVEEMLDVTYVSDEEIAAGEGLARHIGAVTNPARLLERV